MRIMKDVHKRQKQIADLIDNWVGEKRIAPLIMQIIQYLFLVYTSLVLWVSPTAFTSILAFHLINCQ